MPRYVSITGSSSAQAAAPPVPAPGATPPPTSLSKPPVPIPSPVSFKIKYEGHVEMPGRTRGETRAIRDPCKARRFAGKRPLPWSTVDDGACGSDVNTGDLRINRQDRSSTQHPERLAGPADRAYTKSLRANQCIRCRQVASCRLATLDASGVVIWWIGKMVCACVFVCVFK